MINTLVIVPTYNEVDNIQKFIDSVFLIDGLSLLVVDDNSPDGTAKIVESNFENYQNLHLLKREGKLGLGSAYIEGFKWFLNSNYSNCLQMDGDFSHSFNDLKSILDKSLDADFAFSPIFFINKLLDILYLYQIILMNNFFSARIP